MKLENRHVYGHLYATRICSIFVKRVNITYLNISGTTLRAIHLWNMSQDEFEFSHIQLLGNTKMASEKRYLQSSNARHRELVDPTLVTTYVWLWSYWKNTLNGTIQCIDISSNNIKNAAVCLIHKTARLLYEEQDWLDSYVGNISAVCSSLSYLLSI